jgi:hypothetical protein
MTGKHLRTFATLGAAALAAAGCGGSSGSGSGSSSAGTSASGALQRAADVSGAASGYRMAMQMTETLGSAGAVTAVGNGSFNVPKKAGQMTLSMKLPGLVAGTSTLRVEEITEGGNVYLQLPPALASRLPGGKAWLKINIAQAGNAAGVPGLGSLMSSSGSATNPSSFLTYLQSASAGGVRDLGSGTIDGIQTTHYRATVSLTKVAGTVPASRRAQLQKTLAALQKVTGLHEVPVDAWVDNAHLVRRVTMAYRIHVPNQSQTASLSMQMDFTGYGPQPVPPLPPSGQVTDLSAALGGAAGSASG